MLEVGIDRTYLANSSRESVQKKSVETSRLVQVVLHHLQHQIIAHLCAVIHCRTPLNTGTGRLVQILISSKIVGIHLSLNLASYLIKFVSENISTPTEYAMQFFT
jgi:hypothetical protein